MACNPNKRDYYHNKTRYRYAFGQAYQVLQLAERYTSHGACSPRNPETGKLTLQENALERHFLNRVGTPGIEVITANGISNLGQTFGYGAPAIQDVYFKSQCLALALGRFKKQAQSKAILAMEYLSERKTLADQLSALCKKIVEIARLLKQRKFKTIWVYASSAGKKVADRKEMTFHEKWLEVHFSIMPMIDDLVKNINGLDELHAAKLRKRGYYQESITDNGTNYVNAYESRLNFSYRLAVTGEVIIDDPAKASQSLIGLNPSDLYDVIPFSFLLDWLFNVGQIIKGLLIPGISFSNTAITELSKNHTEHWGAVNRSLSPTVTHGQIGGSYYESSASYTRVAGPLPDIPLVWTGGVNSLWRAITSIALARTIFHS